MSIASRRRSSALVRAALCVGALLVLVLAGCGGKSGASNPSNEGMITAAATNQTPTPPNAGSEPRFIARADEICRRGNQRLTRSQPKGKQLTDLAAMVVQNETIERKTAGELARLVPPAKIAPAWTKMLGYRRSLANELGYFAAAIRRGEKKFPRLAQSKKQLHGDVVQVGSRAGFRDCAKIG